MKKRRNIRTSVDLQGAMNLFIDGSAGDSGTRHELDLLSFRSLRCPARAIEREKQTLDANPQWQYLQRKQSDEY